MLIDPIIPTVYLHLSENPIFATSLFPFFPSPLPDAVLSSVIVVDAPPTQPSGENAHLVLQGVDDVADDGEDDEEHDDDDGDGDVFFDHFGGAKWRKGVLVDEREDD